MKTLIVAIALLLLTSITADAQRRRITVQPLPERGHMIEHPYGVTLALSKMLCGFHLFSLGPNPPPRSVGSCANWFNYSQPKGYRYG